MDEANFLGSILATNGVVLAGAIFIVKKWIVEDLAHKYKIKFMEEKSALDNENKRIQVSFSESLKKTSALAITEFQEKLKSANTKSEFTFIKLQEKRVLLLSELFGLLHNVAAKAEAYTIPVRLNGDFTDQERSEHLNIAVSAFHDLFSKNQLFVPRDTRKSIERYMHTVGKEAFIFNRSIETQDNYKGKAEEWKRIYNTVRANSTILLEEIESSFRQLLGEDQ